MSSVKKLRRAPLLCRATVVAGGAYALAADDPALERIRERLRGTTRDQRDLRVLLVLGHELIRARLERGSLHEQVAKTKEDVASAPELGTLLSDYDALVGHIHEVVRDHALEGARILVVSRGDDRLLVPGYQAEHFPQSPGGGYAGFYPADSDAAINHLGELRSRGAEYLIFPETAYWWLDYYEGLARYLLTTARTVVHDGCCLVFDLRPTPQRQS